MKSWVKDFAAIPVELTNWPEDARATIAGVDYASLMNRLQLIPYSTK